MKGMKKGRKREKDVVTTLRSPALTANEKICAVITKKIDQNQIKDAVSYLRETIRDQNKDDGARKEAGAILEALDKKGAAEAYLELAGDNSDNILLRCYAMTFFIREKSVFDSPEFLKKLIYALSPVAYNSGEVPDMVAKQAAITIEMIYGRKTDETIPKKSRELLAMYSDY